ncbi:MAG TPA: LLM class flavin-dependent oxidoreductase [Acidimicrobiales bacterium]|nr:LLM class flavin-dependent oxidoreductase [Acidimicrobiales bacterium]
MRVGIFVDLRNPAGWRRPWVDHYQRSLDRIVAAEQLGAASVWLSEHHGFDDGYLPQPLTLGAAIAARTSRIRIGTAILLGALRHPQHIAEEAAVVDIISGGRVELGLGAGYGVPEYRAFGVDITRRFSRNDAAIAEVQRLLDGGIVTPPAVQRPFPIWAGYQGPQGARRAGRLGVGLLTLNAASLEPYRNGLAAGGHDPATARMGGVIDLVVADDPDAVAARLVPFFAHQQNTYRRLRVQGTDQPPPPDLTDESLRERLATKGNLPGLAVLTPSAAVELVRTRTDGLPVHHVYCWASIAGMDDDLVDRHLELLFTQVAPALAGEDGR